MSEKKAAVTVEQIEDAVRALAEQNRFAAQEIARAESRQTGVAEHLRMVEALLFAAAEPLTTEELRARMPMDADVSALLAQLEVEFSERGVNLVRIAGKWRLQTAPDLAHLLVKERKEPRKLSQAGLETLAIIAYHQPATRAEIEAVRGVAVSRGTLDRLLELGWVRPGRRRRGPGRPVTYVTTDAFLVQFSLEDIADLPGKDELKAAGLLDARLPADFEMPEPGAVPDATGELIADDEEDAGAAFHTDYVDDDDEAGES